MNLYLDLIPNFQAAFTGEEVRSSLLTFLSAVNTEHHKKMFQLPPYGPGDDDPSGHIIDEETEEENNG